ncbi:hypothetical protein EIN_491030 [Entamoeba invadens IP1]|uniref:Uncharacterized protein n=1 Tax=Entamoeba invadens IP1 TaxID=370355 RepID=A0A0A1U9Y9_ENTIV|nr:hypothetical protein EIN_491030 [Entamoeba invadens IP1]ELP88954.1 hypothetical protein EIN_491030 [Entamoeba invadens IP1]|eukprot:XP_004255725.1 hypothetical protein EIN_491030 [Entamoeba invadens IP1]
MQQKAPKEVNAALLRARKTISRNAESAVINTIICIFIRQLDGSATFRKSKKTKNTIKMTIPETLRIGGECYDNSKIASLNDNLMREVIGEEPFNISKMNDKNYTRSKEARTNNGLIYLIKSFGYDFVIRQTKKAKLTERFIKITSIKTPLGVVVDLNRLIEIGIAFEKLVEDSFGREQTCEIGFDQVAQLDVPEFPPCCNEVSCPSIRSDSVLTNTCGTTNSCNSDQMNQFIQNSVQYIGSGDVPNEVYGQIQMPYYQNAQPVYQQVFQYNGQLYFCPMSL